MHQLRFGIYAMCLAGTLAGCEPTKPSRIVDVVDSSTEIESDSSEILKESIFQSEDLQDVWAELLDIPLNSEIWVAAQDRVGNIVLAGVIEEVGYSGTFYPDTDLDPSAYSPPGIFIMKVDPQGNLLWKREFEGHDAHVAAIATDESGNVYWTGNLGDSVSSSLTLDDATLLADIASYTMYIARVSADGTDATGRTVLESDPTYIHHMGVAPDGTLVVVGNMSGIWSMDDEWRFVFGRDSLFVMRFNAELELINLRNHLQLDHYVGAGGMALLDDGTMLLAGSGRGPLVLGDEGIIGEEPDYLFSTRLDAQGDPIWARRYDTRTGTSDVSAIKTGSTEDIFLTGSISTSVDMGSGPLFAEPGSDDMLIARITPDGRHLWSRRIGGPDFDYGTALALDAQDNLLVGGKYKARVDFGGRTLESDSDLLYMRDFFIAMYSPDGELRWVSGTENAQAYSTVSHIFSVDEDEFIVIGNFNGSLKLLESTLQVSNDSSRPFMARFRIRPEALQNSFPFEANPGDTPAVPMPSNYIPEDWRAALDTCEPLFDDFHFCQIDDSVLRLPPTDPPSFASICDSGKDVLVANGAADVSITGLTDSWGSATGTLTVDATLSAAMIGEPQLELVESSSGFLGTPRTLTLSSVGNAHSFDLAWDTGWACGMGYQIALLTSVNVTCSDRTVLVKAWSTHTLCRIDDTCLKTGWAGDADACYSPGFIDEL